MFGWALKVFVTCDYWCHFETVYRVIYIYGTEVS